MNDAHIVAESDNRRLVAAWGCDGGHLGRDRAVMELLGPGRRVDCLGVTKDGHPRHPLYVPYAATPVPFVMPAFAGGGVK
ncbi:MAG: hypothetical protein JWO31_3780 [Phycisphaerales bacterium]|nr:hypothetical protein [Phycisphaerales bacterium]